MAVGCPRPRPPGAGGQERLIQSAKLNDLDLWTYLKDVLMRLTTMPASRSAQPLAARSHPATA